MCTSNKDDRKLENTVKQSWFKHLGELHKEWTEAGVSASRVTTLRRLHEKGYQATSGEKELDCCSVVQSPLFRWKYILHFIWKSRSQSLEKKNGEAQNPCCLKSSVKFPQSVIWACRVICWCWSTHCVFWKVQSQRRPSPRKCLSISCFLLLTSFLEIADFIFQQDLAPVPLPKVQKLVHRESMGYCQEDDERHQT